MSNGYVGDRSWRSEATFTQTGDAAAGYPITQLKNDRVGLVWRSDDATLGNTTFDITFPRLRPVRSVAFINHNFSKTAQITVKFYRDVEKTELLETIGPVDVYPKGVYSSDSPIISWDAGNFWFRTIQDEDNRNKTQQFAKYTTQRRFVRTIEVTIDDSDNSAGFVQLGVVDPADGFFFPYQYDYGAQYGIRSRTINTESAGGGEYSRVEEPRDVIVATIPYNPIDFALETWYEFQRRCDTHTPFWWAHDIDDIRNAHRLSYWAKNDDISLATYAIFENNSTPFAFKRVL